MPEKKGIDPIKRHLSDKNDKISEDDIRNVNTNPPAEEGADDKEKNEEKDHPKKELPSAWDIMDEDS